MRGWQLLLCITLALGTLPGCALRPLQSDFFSREETFLPSSAQTILTASFQAEEKTEPPAKRPRTLMEWQLFKTEVEEDEEEEPLQADRPDFTESSNTVGLGRMQLESGYTFTRDRQSGVTTRSHSYPEALLRIGMFAEWFELRLGQNFGHERSSPQGQQHAGASSRGAEDLYLGFKFFLAEQQKFLPEHSLIVQMRLPTGSSAFSANEVLPGVAYWFGWDVIKDKISLAGGVTANRAREDSGHFYTEIAESASIAFELTKRLGAYTEWFAICPSGAVDGETGPEYYFDAGLTYFITSNFRIDARAGLGLNDHADDFFTGAGFVVRY